MHNEAHLKVLRCIEGNPEISQRELAKELGISLGKTNYCVKALMEKGWVKAKNFKNSKNKLAYVYVLTPTGLDQKSRMTYAFLRRKEAEFEALRLEIELLAKEVEESS